MSTLRLFIAVETPAGVRREMGRLQRELAAAPVDVRWEKSEKLHCTLAFLGSVPDSTVASLERELRVAVAGISAFAVRYEGVGFFPDNRRPKIIWVGMADDGGALSHLQQAVTGAVSAAGIRCDDKPFHPHVTIGRVRSGDFAGRLTTIAESLTLDHPPVTVQEVRIVRSELRPGGSVYAALRSIPLSR
jgi:2'-5' RNA ligase